MNAQIPIFDIDTRFTEPPDLWTSRAPGRFGIQSVSIASPDGRKLTSREYANHGVTELDADERGNSKR
jgi:hypothetical protein